MMIFSYTYLFFFMWSNGFIVLISCNFNNYSWIKSFSHLLYPAFAEELAHEKNRNYGSGWVF